MDKRKRIKKLVTIIILLISILVPEKSVQADEKPEVRIIDGELTFKTVDKKASTTTRWKTVGFTICKQNTGGYPRQDTDGNTKTKDYATVWLDDDDKTQVPIGDGQVEVTFYINEDTINKALDKTSLGEIVKDGDTIYLNGIFHVLHGDEEDDTDYYDWKGDHGIADAEPWASGPSDFQDHFNIPVTYSTTYTYPITIDRYLYHSTGNEFVDSTSYPEQKKNTKFSTNSSKIPTTIIAGDDTYYLYRTYYVKLDKLNSKLGNRKTDINPYVSEDSYYKALNDGDTPIRNRTFNVSDEGGIKIYSLYRRFVAPDESEVVDEKHRDFEEDDPTAVLLADSRDNETYDVLDGIPGTESLYANVFTNEYLSAYKFVKTAGTKMYKVNVTKTYKLSWTETHTSTDADGNTVTETEHKTEVVPVTKTYYVERPFSYWSIESLAVYGIDNAVLENDVIPGGSVTLTPSGYSSPTVSYTHSEQEEDHITEPTNPGEPVDYSIPGIETINDDAAPDESYQVEAEDQIGNILCKNDKVLFKGETIMTDTEQENETEEPAEIPESSTIGENVLYKSNLVIPAETANEEYETEGTVTYKPVVEFEMDTDTEHEIEDINSIVVHTPTVCDAQVQNNIQDNQMLNPDTSRASLVLDRPFNVKLPTEGNHREIIGYGYNDYAKYIASRQVKFPFDVYKGSSASGTYIKKNTWTSVSTTTQFYLPTWVDEGKYTVSFRSIAINSEANNGSSQTETMANLDLTNYVATDTVKVEVSGRVYGLKLYDISDYPVWEDVFRIPNSLSLTGFNYTVGTKDENGASNGQNSKFTLSLINGSHPEYINNGAIKTGYVTRFSLRTVGNMYDEDDYIRIKPIFYYVDQTGQNRQEVDIYYSETFNGKKNIMVKMGSNLDLQNKKSLITGDPYLAIQEEALKQTAQYEDVPLNEWKAQKKNVFTFTNIMIPDSLRTFVGYIANVPTGVTEQTVAESVQNWYGEYYLPSEIHVVPKGFNVEDYVKIYGGLNYNEPFWLEDGFIIINFEIETIKDGERHLSYINADNANNGYCNMWLREGYQYEKSDYKGNKFYFQDGDYILYYNDKSAGNDYISAGTH